MQKKHAANGHAPLVDFAITITPQVRKDGKWYVAFCPEVPEANGQGRTREESVKDLKDGIESIMQDRRQDARSRAPLHSIHTRWGETLSNRNSILSNKVTTPKALLVV